MRKSLLLFVVFAASVAPGRADPGYARTLPRFGSGRSDVANLKMHTKALLVGAAQRGLQLRGVAIGEVLGAMDRLRLHVPAPGEDFELCRQYPQAAMLTPAGDTRNVYVCAGLLDHLQIPVDFESLHMSRINALAQTLIHELVHLCGIDDDCTATAVERAVMRSAGIAPYMNHYVAGCGL